MLFRSGEGYTFPCLFKNSDKGWILISETGVNSYYCGSRLMGVGTPANILEAVDRGVDFFDCVYPSRNGRHGHVYTKHGKLNLFNAKFELDERPIEEGCQCPACRRYSRAYIRHLLKAKEMLGMRLCVLHNLYYYNHLMEDIRGAIEEGRYAQFKKETLAKMEEKED